MKCPKCKTPPKDRFAGKNDICSTCNHKLAYGDPFMRCDKHKWSQCVFCSTGETRPSDEKEHDTDESDADEEVEVLPTGKTTGVPKKTAKETPREQSRREAAEVKQREKMRILNAKTRGLPPICKAEQVYPPVPNDAYPHVSSGPGFMAGGKQVPIMNHPKENGTGFMLFQAVDFTAEHPSGIRKSFRRGQRIWAHAAKYPAEYKPLNNDWSLIVLHLVVETHNGKFHQYPRIHCAPWAHINKGRCKVSRFVLDLGPEDVRESELHVCPLIEEDTHHQKFVSVTHSTYMVTILAAQKAKLESLAQEEPPPSPPPTPEKPVVDVPVPPSQPPGPVPDILSPKRKQHTLSYKIAALPSWEELKAAQKAKKPRLTYDSSKTFAANMCVFLSQCSSLPFAIITLFGMACTGQGLQRNSKKSWLTMPSCKQPQRRTQRS